MEWKNIKNIRGLSSVTTIGSSNIIGSAITSAFWIFIAGIIGTESYGELGYFLSIIVFNIFINIFKSFFG